MSDPHASGDASNPALAKNNTVDAFVALILLLVGVVVIFEARRLGCRLDHRRPGGRLFPLLHRAGPLYFGPGHLLPGHGRPIERYRRLRGP